MSKRVSKPFKTIYYIFAMEFGSKPPDLDWEFRFPDVNIQYIQDIPDLKFWDNIEPHSLVVIDDLYSEAVNNQNLIKSFKVLLSIHYYDINNFSLRYSPVRSMLA